MDEEKEPKFKEVTTGQEQPAKKGILEELEELRSNGETSTARYKELLEEVEVIFGTGETNRFGTNDVNILRDRLKKMTKADLQSFARKIGINPYYAQSAAIDNIIKEFNRYQSRGNIFTAPQPTPAIQLDPNNPQHQDILDWLNS